jgi:membrane associated rhomboid family serine protease
MPMQVKSCPKCGAMITPQLARCRQCKTYLHGLGVEGLLFENLLPPQLQRAPGTATLLLSICLYYGLMVLLSRHGSLGGFSGFTSTQLGAIQGAGMFLGEYWRAVTSMFAHDGLFHLFMNVGALVMVGDIVEQTLDRKKMLLIYLACGVLSMLSSCAWSTFVRGHILSTSVGASGALCGLIGAAWFSARKLGPQGAHIVSRMKIWALLMLLIGLVPRIDAVSHFSGFVIGAALAHLVPVGLTQNVRTQKVLSVVMLAAFLAVAGSVAMMIQHVRGFPLVLEDDLYRGKEWEHSDQKRMSENCLETQSLEKPTDDAIRKCELARRAHPGEPANYLVLAQHFTARGDTSRAEKLRLVARKISPRRF